MATTRSRAKRIAETCHFALVPNEIIEQHIFSYYCFNNWVLLFSPVCKRWKQICETANIAPKQVRLPSRWEITFTLADAVAIVRKYQPDILTVPYGELIRHPYSVNLLVDASKRLTTLIIKEADYQRILCKPVEKVTTLAILDVDKDEKFLRENFPNVKRVQIDYSNHFYGQASPMLPSSVEDLTISYSGMPPYKVIGPESYTLVQRSGELSVCKIDEVEKLDEKELSYEKYFRTFGQTRLEKALQLKDFQTAAQLLDKETTMDYEEYLHTNLSYKYATALTSRRFNYYTYFLLENYSNICFKEAYELLVRTNKITVPNEMKFASFVYYGQIDEAMELLQNGISVESSTINSFFRMLLSPKVTKRSLARQPLLGIALQMVNGYSEKYLTDKIQWDKISFLREDWSDTYASVRNVSLFQAMLEKGCTIPFDKLDMRDVDPKSVDLVMQKGSNEIKWKVAEKYDVDKLKDLMVTYNFDGTLEHNGCSLLNKLITDKREFSSTFWTHHSHIINHMDTNGNTPLISFLKKSSQCGIDDLVKNGADPNLHRGDFLSPLAMIIVKVDRTDNDSIISNICILTAYGADVNAPCLYKERMCSPLMIAILVNACSRIIKLLIVLGARTDYQDENGRTIIDCAKEHFGYQKLLNLLSFK